MHNKSIWLCGTGDTAGYTGLWIQIDLSNASDYHVTKVRIYPSKP